MKGWISVGWSSNGSDGELGSRSGIAMGHGDKCNEYIIYIFAVIGSHIFSPVSHC